MRPAQKRTAHIGHDPEGRKTFDRYRGPLGAAMNVTGGEGALLNAAEPYPNADVWFKAPTDNLASLVGARFRLYAHAGGTRTLIGESTITVAPTADQGFLALSMRGRGGLDRLEVTLFVDPGAGALPATDIDVSCTSWDSGGDEDQASPAPPGPVPAPGSPQWTGAQTFAQRGVVKATPGKLYRIDGTIDPAAPAGSLWVQVFDKATNPANGDTPVWRAYVGAGGSWAWARDGRDFVNGISWALSTTRDVLTLGAAGDVGGTDAEFT